MIPTGYISKYENGDFICVPFEQVSDDDLITEFGCESWANDRCIGDETKESDRLLSEMRTELLRRMAK
jgi:hypothetical protein